MLWMFRDLELWKREVQRGCRGGGVCFECGNIFVAGTVLGRAHVVGVIWKRNGDLVKDL